LKADVNILVLLNLVVPGNPGGEGDDTPYNGLYGEAPPERGNFFRLQVYKREGFRKLRYIKG